MAENETFRFLKPFRKWLSAFSGVRQTHVPSRFSSGFGHVRARFDAAQTTADNARHWIMADSLSADAEANADVRRILRIRSRYEIANNSYAKGLVLMLANDTVGTGPRLQLLTENEPFNDEAENDFSEWMRAVKLPRKLRLMRISRCQDGEAFGILTTNPEIRGGVKLDLRLIEADRVCGEFSGGDEENAADGVYRDQWGNPKAYRVLKTHPGDNRAAWNGSENEAEMIPAEYMIHAFLQNRPEQHRGIPELQPALPLFAQLRRYNLAVLSQAEQAADFAAILYTDTPPSGESENVAPLDSIELQRNMMLTVPAGWKMAQLDAKQPTGSHGDFVKIILSEVQRCVAATYGTAAGDYSGHNYASGRLDNQLYRKSILIDRAFWENEVLNRVFELWYREYALQKGLNGAEIPRHTWFWDSFVHVDPVKEASAQNTRLRSMTTTLAAECAKDGQDYMSVLRQRAKELRLMKKLGFPADAVTVSPDETADSAESPENEDGAEQKEEYEL